jgi:hypothetical protein
MSRYALSKIYATSYHHSLFIHRHKIISRSFIIPTLLDLLQTQYDSTLSIAKRLYEEDCLEKPNIEAPILRALQILMEEYTSNPESIISIVF